MFCGTFSASVSGHHLRDVSIAVWSPRVLNPIIWTRLGKTHTCLSEVSQLTLSESKPEEELSPRDQKQGWRHGNGDVLHRNPAALKPPQRSVTSIVQKRKKSGTPKTLPRAARLSKPNNLEKH